MISLEKNSGLPIFLKDSKLVFSKNVKAVKPAVRRLYEMNDIFYKKVRGSNKIMYYMYRGVCFKKDEIEFLKRNLRYDITILKPCKIGKEYNKTYGHVHKTQEIYSVIYGKAIFLLQKKNEILICEAKENEAILIKPGYFHLTINPGKKPLVIANIIKKNVKADYSISKKMHGAAIYKLDKGWVKNKNYKIKFKIKKLKAKKLNKPLYVEFIEHPSNF